MKRFMIQIRAHFKEEQPVTEARPTPKEKKKNRCDVTLRIITSLQVCDVHVSYFFAWSVLFNFVSFTDSCRESCA